MKAVVAFATQQLTHQPAVAPEKEKVLCLPGMYLTCMVYLY